MPARHVVSFLLAAAVAGVLAHGIVAVPAPGGTLSHALYVTVALLLVGLVGARAVIRTADRAAWLLFAVSLACWLAGDVLWAQLGQPAFPAVSDALYVASYAAQLAALGLLLRARVRLLPGARWLDGLVVGLTLAALVAAALLGPIAEAASDAAVVETLLYPTLDLALIVLVAVPVGMTGWRPGRALGWLTASVTLLALTDVLYARQEAEGAFVEGGVLTTLWLAAYTATAVAAWQAEDRREFDTRPRRREGIVPGACGFAAIIVLTAAAFFDLGVLTVGLAAAAALLTGVRASLLYVQQMELIARGREEARIDALSGLPNRRALVADLDGVFDGGSPVTLAFFDLDGFKLYNDSFGHAAGDALLQRLGRRLSAAVCGHGCAYRLGGDEFCVLLDGDGLMAERLLLDIGAALRERGDGFAIAASAGSVAIPAEASEPGEALRIADRRMYAQKANRRGPARHQASELLLAVVRETEPDLDEHNGDVGRLARQLGERLGLDDDELDIVVRGAELHDVGKVAVPDEILHKPAALTDDEWQLMRQHTIIGERILLASPGMAPVATLVRASHERWDGGGYPDGLRGEEIPLGARIIAVCDAFDAIVSDRPYAQGRPIGEALAELERCAGAQFDPAVVTAFLDLVRSGALGLGVQYA